MPGMGLLRRRSGESQQASEECLILQEDLQKSWEANGCAEAIKQALQQVSTSNDAVHRFRILEAVDNLLEEQDSDFAGLPEGFRTSLLHLLYSAWVTVARQLKCKGLLDVSTVPNWKFVLRRAIATADSLNSLCSSDSSCTQAPDVLQELLDSVQHHNNEQQEQEEEPAAGPSGTAQQEDQQLQEEEQVDDEFNFNTRWSIFQWDTAGLLQGPGNQVAGAQSETSTVGIELQQQELQQSRDEEALEQWQAKRISTGANDDELDAKLAALDDPCMRRILLQIVTRLPADHPLRQEVEQDVGHTVGSPGFKAALDEAIQMAIAAGVDVPTNANAAQNLQLTALQLPTTSDLDTTDALDSLRQTDTLGLMGLGTADLSQETGRNGMRGLSALFSPTGIEGLLEDGGLETGSEGFATGNGTKAALNALNASNSGANVDTSYNSMNSTMLGMSGSSAVMPSSSVLLPNMAGVRDINNSGNPNTASAMASLTTMLPNMDGTDSSAAGARLEFSLQDTNGLPSGIGSAAVDDTYLLQEAAAPSPGPWATSSTAIAGTAVNTASQGPRSVSPAYPLFASIGDVTGTDYVPSDGDFDASWLAGDGNGEDAGAASWDMPYQGPPVATTLGGPVKRTASLLGRPNIKQPRVA